MKTIIKIFFIILLCVSNYSAKAQSLNSMPEAKRNSLLISIAKEAILKFGPDYYREYKEPKISYKQYPPADPKTDKRFVNWDDRYYYEVEFYYDPAEETLEWGFAAKVRIWADTGDLHTAFFGNGYGRSIEEGMDWRNDKTLEIVPYQESITPLYDINNPDPNQEPVNKDVLLKKGYVKDPDKPDRWIKTTPDVPPHKRVKQ